MSGSSSRSSFLFRSALLFAVALITICGVFLYGLYERYVTQRRDRELRMFATIGTIANYSDVMGEIPKAVYFDESGSAIRSWRLEILRYSPMSLAVPNENVLWSDNANAAITLKPIWMYCFHSPRDKKSCDTNIVAITGNGTAFQPGNERHLRSLPRDSIVLIEVDKSGIPWAAPGDLDVDKIPVTLRLGSGGGGVHVAFADHVIWCLRSDVPLSSLGMFFRIKDAERFDREAVLGEYILYRHE